MKRKLQWFAWNAGALAFVYLGVYGGKRGVWNVFVFYTWFAVVASFTAFNDKVRADMRAKGRAMPGWVSVLVDVGIVAALAAAGHFATAAAWAWTIVVESYIYSKPAEPAVAVASPVDPPPPRPEQRLQ